MALQRLSSIAGLLLLWSYSGLFQVTSGQPGLRGYSAGRSAQFFSRDFGARHQRQPYSLAHEASFDQTGFLASNNHVGFSPIAEAPGRPTEPQLLKFVPSDGFKPISSPPPSFGGFEHQGDIQQVKSCPMMENRKSYCQIYAKCAVYLPDILAKAGTIVLCTTEYGDAGMCCPIVKKNAVVPAPQIAPHQALNPSTVQQFAHSSALEDALESTKIYLKEFEIFEQGIMNRTIFPKPGTASHGHLVFSRTSSRAIKIARVGTILTEATRYLVGNYQTHLGQSVVDAVDELRAVSVERTSIGGKCPAPVVCDPATLNYRSVDGTCNNLQNPLWGSAFLPEMRVVRPAYADGVYAPRISVTGSELPSARLLSTNFAPDVNNPNPYYTQWTMQFGQFVNHDLTHVPFHRFANGSGIECCSEDGDFLPPSQTHPFCFPIEIPDDDYFYAPRGQRCMNFVRSMTAPHEDCSLGYADQLSQITAILDNSNVYASTREEHDALREFRLGRMRTDRHISQTPPGYRGHLPLQTSTENNDMCTDPDSGTFCFRAGDLRANQIISLTLTHTIWLREHNRLAGILHELNPLWTDDRLFQEARRILNAEYQHIIFNEWLPIIIGRNYMETYGILPQAEGYYRGYDPNTNPTISNAFAVAAFRMGHSLIQGILPLINNRGQVERELELHDFFNNPFALRQRTVVDNLLRGISHSTMQNFDKYFTGEVTNRLFQPRNQTFGLDLVSFNIQRGRDHGVPGYNTFRELCQLGRANHFEDFADWIPAATVQKLARFYQSVDDVDLYIGGILERPVPGALVGPTFLCLIGDQFARTRRGDRFMYDAGPSSHSFNLPQLQELRKSSFARIICDNGDAITHIQPFAFLIANAEYNPVVDCDSIPRPDYSSWKVECSSLYCDK